MKSLQDIENRFDDRYMMPKGDLPKGFADDIKQFYSDEIKEILQDIVPKPKLVDRSGNVITDSVMDGWNACRNEVLDNINHTLTLTTI